MILDGGNKLKKFKRHVQAALGRNNYEELKGLIEEISALKIMQVYPRPSSPLISEREAYELKVEYKRMIEMIEEAKIKLRKLRSSK